MTYKLYAVRVFSRDWEATTRFYREILTLPEKFSNPELGWAEFDIGGPSLAVERIDPGDEEGLALTGRFLGISLEVEDVEGTYRKLLARGVDFLEPPARQPWGGVLAHCRDPEGNVLTLLGS